MILYHLRSSTDHEVIPWCMTLFFIGYDVCKCVKIHFQCNLFVSCAYAFCGWYDHLTFIDIYFIQYNIQPLVQIFFYCLICFKNIRDILNSFCEWPQRICFAY